jgi:cation:H+ antiporter
LDVSVAAGLFVVGLGLIFHFREDLVKGAVGASSGLGTTAYIVSIVLIVLDPGNLIVGITGSIEGLAGIALGSVVGASMVTMALATGVMTLITPVSFQDSPRRVLVLPLMAEVLFGILSLDGLISRTDGSVLLLGFVLSALYLLRLSKRGLDIRPSGEIVSVLDKGASLGRRESLLLIGVSVAALVIGSIILLAGARVLMAGFGVSDTAFGMTVLPLLVGLEGLVREFPAFIRKRVEMSYAVITGPTLAFFLFNAGVIASVQPVPVDARTLSFYLPLTVVTTIVSSAFMYTGRIPRWGGALLLILYMAFFAGGFVQAPW